MKIDERLLAYKPISVTLNFDWEKMSYDERVLARHNYIEEQKKKDPNYIGWDFIEYVVSTHGEKYKQTHFCISKTKIINTIGQICYFNKKLGKNVISFGYQKSSYRTANAWFKETGDFYIRLHRAVACTFIPIPKELRNNIKKLVVGHKDDIKQNNFRSNLEWVTNEQNTKHAVKTGRIKSRNVKGVWMIEDEFFGREIYFKSRTEALEIIPYSSGIIDSINNGTIHNGFMWFVVSDEEIPDQWVGIEDELLKRIKDRPYVCINSKPILGTVVNDSALKGLKFIVIGTLEIKKLNFNLGNVKASASGLRPKAHGCSWEYIKKIDVRKYQRGLSEEQLMLLQKGT